MTEEEEVVIKVENGALTSALAFTHHSRARNWFAKISLDPKKPNGLERVFARRAHGDYYYLIEDWMVVGAPVEFGADYYSCSGNPRRHRVYAVIKSISRDGMTFWICKDGREAVERAGKMSRSIAVEGDGMKLINLTPHPVVIEKPDGERITVEPSGTVARCEDVRSEDGKINGIPLSSVRYGAIVGLPAPEVGTMYIVSAMVAERAARRDVVAPDTGAGAVRDAAGRIVAVRGLVRCGAQ